VLNIPAFKIEAIFLQYNPAWVLRSQLRFFQNL
jgi:hypothetical protein